MKKFAPSLPATGRETLHFNAKKKVPRTVYHYYYLKAVSNVNMKENSFRVFYHQYLSWYPTDEEMATFTAAKKAGSSSVEGVFVPRILPSNAIEIASEEDELRGSSMALHVLEDGGLDIWGARVKISSGKAMLGISRKYQVLLSSCFQLREFPLDLQHLHIFFESMETSATIIYRPAITYETVLDLEFGAIASDADYIFHPPVVEFNVFSEYACCTVTLKLERRFRGVFFRIFMPCGVLTALCFSVFFIPYADVADRLGVLVTLILALVAFLYVVSEQTPPIPYLTLCDEYINGTLSFVTMLTVWVCVGSTKWGVVNQYQDSLAAAAAVSVWVLGHVIIILMAYRAKASSMNLLKSSYSDLSDAGLLEQASTSISIATAEARIID